MNTKASPTQYRYCLSSNDMDIIKHYTDKDFEVYDEKCYMALSEQKDIKKELDGMRY